MLRCCITPVESMTPHPGPDSSVIITSWHLTDGCDSGFPRTQPGFRDPQLQVKLSNFQGREELLHSLWVSVLIIFVVVEQYHTQISKGLPLPSIYRCVLCSCLSCNVTIKRTGTRRPLVNVNSFAKKSVASYILKHWGWQCFIDPHWTALRCTATHITRQMVLTGPDL